MDAVFAARGLIRCVPPSINSLRRFRFLCLRTGPAASLPNNRKSGDEALENSFLLKIEPPRALLQVFLFDWIQDSREKDLFFREGNTLLLTRNSRVKGSCGRATKMADK